MDGSALSVNWAVSGRALETPGRAGGMNAEKGFVFQRSYAAWLLTGLLTGAGGVVALRYEGAQDVDLRLFDGTEIYAQVKGYELTELDWTGARGILSRFVADLQAARAAIGAELSARLSFRLVAAASVGSNDVLDLFRRKRIDKHVARLVRELAAKGSASAVKLDLEDVLSRMNAELLPAGIPKEVFRLMAEARLARFGVRADEIDAALRALLDAITWRETIGSAEVLRWIADYLPPAHPCSIVGSMVAFGSRTRSQTGSVALFYTSQSDVWEGIASELDVPRDAAGALRDAVTSSVCPKILVHGPSGAGKSTLARRVMWDLQVEGRIVAIEFRGPEMSDAEWTATVRLAARLRAEGGPRVVLLVDDVHEHPLLAQRVAELDASSDLGVVMTAWTVGAGGVGLGAGLQPLPLASISEGEAAVAATRLGRDLVAIPNARLAALLKAGQFIVLNMVLLEGTDFVSFGGRLLDSVKARVPTLVAAYVDLCACGADDRSVPFDVMQRLHGVAIDLVADPAMKGLVFTIGVGRIKSGHRILAGAVAAAAPQNRLTRLLEIASAVDPAVAEERRFGIGVLEDLVASADFSIGLAPPLERLARLFAGVGQYLDVRRCARLLAAAGLQASATEVEALADFSRVETGPDAAAYRSDHGARNPAGVFDRLLGFYSGNPTSWGWRNLLHMAKEMDASRRARALDVARQRLSSEVDVATVTTVIELMNAGDTPASSVDFAVSILERMPPNVGIARAVTQLIIDRLRSPRLFATLVDYASPLVDGSGEGLRLARHITSASRRGDSADRRRLLQVLMPLLDELTDENDRATLLHTCANLASGEDVGHISARVGIERADEPPRLNAARHILRRKAG